MKPIIIAKKFTLTDDIRDRVQRKLNKLDKFFSPETEAAVTIREFRGRITVEITIYRGNTIFRAEEVDKEAIFAIDHAVDVIERQIRKNRTRLEKKLHISSKPVYENEEEAVEDVADAEEDIKVCKVKKFDFRPMTVEEAIMQMNLLSHEFYMFKNVETNELNLVYKRNNNDYGLIMPKED